MRGTAPNYPTIAASQMKELGTALMQAIPTDMSEEAARFWLGKKKHLGDLVRRTLLSIDQSPILVLRGRIEVLRPSNYSDRYNFANIPGLTVESDFYQKCFLEGSLRYSGQRLISVQYFDITRDATAAEVCDRITPERLPAWVPASLIRHWILVRRLGPLVDVGPNLHRNIFFFDRGIMRVRWNSEKKHWSVRGGVEEGSHIKFFPGDRVFVPYVE